MIYFLRAQSGEGPIKIGFASTMVRNRMESLQSYSPVLLMIIAVIEDATLKDEYALHQRFDQHRMWGEWFEPVPELLALIEKQRAIGHPEQDCRFVPNPHRGNWNRTHHGPGDMRRRRRFSAQKLLAAKSAP
jgi:hypothetical protein